MSATIATFLDASSIACAARQPASIDVWRTFDLTRDEQVAERIGDSHVLITNKARLPQATIATAPNLELVIVAATGYDIIDLAACRAKGVTVCNSPGYSVSSVPEHALALMLAIARRLLPLSREAGDGTWAAADNFCLHTHTAIELAGRRVGIIGAGSLGRATGRLCAAIGMEVCYLARHDGKKDELPRLPLDELLASCDVISLHCPLTAANHHLLDAAALAKLKDGAIVVNTARGALIEPKALIAALEAGRLGGAAIDVLETEPPPADHPLLRCRHPRLIVTPHVGWASLEAQQRLVAMICATCDSYFAGKPQFVVS